MKAKIIRTDSELVQELSQSFSGAFDELFNSYALKIFCFAKSILKSKEEAEEVVQNTFLIVWEKRQIIDHNQSFKSFLFSVAYNVTMDRFRLRIRDRKYRDYVLMNAISFYDGEQLLVSKDLFHNVENIVEELPPRRREIFTLRQIKGLSYKEISKELNISVKTVENNINLAIKYIKGRISKNFILILPGISFFL